MNDQIDTNANLLDHVSQASQVANLIRREIGKALVGQLPVVNQILVSLLAAGHVLIEGVPGLGKTLLVRTLAKTFAGQFSRIQFTPDLMPSDITGHAIFDLKSEQFKIRRGPVFTNLLLADEINRAPAKTQAALLEVMQEQQVTIEGKAFVMSPPFMTLATQNPIEQEGTYPLPEAQLDRFLLKVFMDYPPINEEAAMVSRVTTQVVGDSLNVEEVNVVSNPDTVVSLQKVTAAIQVDTAVIDYAVRIVRATRDWPGIRIGAGPRGGIALIRASRACALLENRHFVTPADIKSIALAALRHRIALAPELEIEGQSSDDVLKQLLDQVDAPRT